MANLCQNVARKDVTGNVNGGIVVFLELGALIIVAIARQNGVNARKVQPAVRTKRPFTGRFLIPPSPV